MNEINIVLSVFVQRRSTAVYHIPFIVICGSFIDHSQNDAKRVSRPGNS